MPPDTSESPMQSDVTNPSHHATSRDWQSQLAARKVELANAKEEHAKIKEEHTEIKEEHAELQEKCNGYEARLDKLENMMQSLLAGQTRLFTDAQCTSRRSRAEHETIAALLYKHEHVLRANQMVGPLQADGTAPPHPGNVNLDPSLDEAKLAVAVEDLERTDKVGWGVNQLHTPPEPASR